MLDPEVDYLIVDIILAVLQLVRRKLNEEHFGHLVSLEWWKWINEPKWSKASGAGNPCDPSFHHDQEKMIQNL